jgi:hypothetical protein
LCKQAEDAFLHLTKSDIFFGEKVAHGETIKSDLRHSAFAAGLPDFLSAQHTKTGKNRPKDHKYSNSLRNIPNTCIKWPFKMPKFSTPKCIKIEIFG